MATPTEQDVPSAKVLHNAAKLSIQHDSPILLDYYIESKKGDAFIGQHTKTAEKMLIKSSEEYTSTIQKIFKVDDCYIVMTENSIYIVSAEIKARKISVSSN